MAYSDILNELRAKLGESKEENEKILKAEGERFGQEGNFDGVKAVGELLLEQMSEERRAEVTRLTHLDGKLLEEYYQDIVALMDDRKMVEAKNLAEKLYKKIDERTEANKEYAQTIKKLTEQLAVANEELYGSRSHRGSSKGIKHDDGMQRT